MCDTSYLRHVVYWPGLVPGLVEDCSAHSVTAAASAVFSWKHCCGFFLCFPASHDFPFHICHDATLFPRFFFFSFFAAPLFFFLLLPLPTPLPNCTKGGGKKGKILGYIPFSSSSSVAAAVAFPFPPSDDEIYCWVSAREGSSFPFIKTRLFQTFLRCSLNCMAVCLD